MATHQFCTFFLGEHVFGVEVEQVQEVIKHQEMTRVPLAPKVIGGLINLRGQIVTAIDLRERLAMPDRSEEVLPMNVVVRSTGGSVSLLVDEIGDVMDVDRSGFEPVPETLQGPTRDLIRGVYKLAHTLLLVLDVERTTSVSARPA